MKKILMLGNSTASMLLLRYAQKRGMYIIVTDYIPYEKSELKQAADESWQISTGDIEQLEQKCREADVTAIFAGISEFNLASTFQLCERLNLPCYCTPEIWNKVSNKYIFKQMCKEHGVSVATDYEVSNPPTEEELNKIQFPVVVKPIDQCANNGISFCYTKEDVVKGCEYARSVSDQETLIVERMLHGSEYAAYYAMADGEARLLMLTNSLSQPGYPTNCYSFTYSTQLHWKEYMEQVNDNVCEMLKDAGCRDGVCFVQVFYDEDQHFYAVEMGYRLSGDLMALPLRERPGFDSFDWMLDTATGRKHLVENLPDTKDGAFDGNACSYIIWSKNAGTVSCIEGIEELEKENIHVQCVAKTGKAFVQYQYLLVITFVSEDYHHMIETIKKVNDIVKIYDQNGNDPGIYFNHFEPIIETEKYR